jgi:glycerophosphoryl diester phosphodiesterase
MKKTVRHIAIFTVICIASCSRSAEMTDVTVDMKDHFMIAHAGGEIDNYIYTNSLEALNKSYSKGCRLFELDIRETSDGKLVAVHNWEQFKQMTGYQSEINDIALTEQEVLHSKIYGRFTPMNMQMINKWFAQHSDAILITDKINSPQKIADTTIGFQFINRCVMELFSWKAIDEARMYNITPMASENLLFDADTSKTLQLLNQKHITYLCFSHHSIKKNKEFIQKLTANGFVSYIFHVNDDTIINEKYVYENYIGLVNGMYADNLDLLQIQL